MAENSQQLAEACAAHEKSAVNPLGSTIMHAADVALHCAVLADVGCWATKCGCLLEARPSLITPELRRQKHRIAWLCRSLWTRMVVQMRQSWQSQVLGSCCRSVRSLDEGTLPCSGFHVVLCCRGHTLPRACYSGQPVTCPCYEG